jgi:hypothetical protein
MRKREFTFVYAAEIESGGLKIDNDSFRALWKRVNSSESRSPGSKNP